MTHEQIAKRNIRGAFNWIVGGYYNCIQDGYEEDLPETREDLINEIYEAAMFDKFSGHVIYDGAPKEMRFAGKEFCMKVINHLMETDEDVAEIAEVRGWDK